MTWSGCKGYIFCLELDVSSVKFCDSLLKGKGPRLRRCWGRIQCLFHFGLMRGLLHRLVPRRSRTSLFRAENKMRVIKMCMVNITGVFPAKDTFRVSQPFVGRATDLPQPSPVCF